MELTLYGEGRHQSNTYKIWLRSVLHCYLIDIVSFNISFTYEYNPLLSGPYILKSGQQTESQFETHGH